MNDLTHQAGRHPVNVGHLVMGLAFLGLTAVWAVVQSGAVEGADIRWLLPLPWVLAGAAGLVVSASNARRRHEPRPATSYAADTEHHEDHEEMR